MKPGYSSHLFSASEFETNRNFTCFKLKTGVGLCTLHVLSHKHQSIAFSQDDDEFRILLRLFHLN